jgi:hypothetical protein
MLWLSLLLDSVRLVLLWLVFILADKLLHRRGSILGFVRHLNCRGSFTLRMQKESLAVTTFRPGVVEHCFRVNKSLMEVPVALRGALFRSLTLRQLLLHI